MNSPRSRRSRSLSVLALALLAGCSGLKPKGTPKTSWMNLSQERLSDLALSFRQVGDRDYVLFKMPERHYYLEGYILGMVTDYQENPIAGVVVAASLEGEEQLAKLLGPSRSGMPSPTFDAGISDSKGIYRIRFSIPVEDGLVDARGKLVYNPQWEQERANLGKAYEPQRRESSFRLFYEQASGLIAFTEGLGRVVVQPVFGTPAKAPLPGAQAPAATPPPAAQRQGGGQGGAEDLLRSMFGQ